MGPEFQDHLRSKVRDLSDENYEESSAFYRFWFRIGITHSEITPDQILGDIMALSGSSLGVSYKDDKLFHTTSRTHLIIRFASDVESDSTLAPHTAGLQSRICTATLRSFFVTNFVRMFLSKGTWEDEFISNVNFIAVWANLGYVEESVIRNDILQSLIFEPKLRNHQVDAIIILFKIAGATFEAYADPSVVDRCFKLLKDHYDHDTTKGKLVQEVLDLRERDWEGLPPPPVFMAERLDATSENQNDPATTPVATPPGLPNRDSEPLIHQPPRLEATVPEIDAIPVSPITQSPSVSIATLPDSTVADTSNDEISIDPMAIIPHDEFYLKNGNVEVLCGNRLFRVHLTVLCLYSPAFRQIFVPDNLAPESPNGCSRFLSSYAAMDFATLLKLIYRSGFRERDKVPDFHTFSSLLRITAKYEMSTIRSQLIEVVCDAYPEGVTPARTLGENVFSGPAPHPNEVLNLFVQEELISALPMAYYMAAQRGVDSLMDRRLPQGATLSPEVLQTAIKGFITLREVELKETHRLVFGPAEYPESCSAADCPSRTPASPVAWKARQWVFDYMVGPSGRGTKAFAFWVDPKETECIFLKNCKNCVERWESGHAYVGEKVGAMLSDAFGFKR